MSNPKLVVITGAPNIGKTTFMQNVFNHLEKNGLLVGGIIEVKTSISTYAVYNLLTEEKIPWAELRNSTTTSNTDTNCPYLFFDHNLPDIDRSVQYSLTTKITNYTFLFDEFGRIEIDQNGLITLFDDFALQAKNAIVTVQHRVLLDFLATYSQYFRRQLVLNLNDHNDRERLLSQIDQFLATT
jgi:nucleoside-triphosphatase THEP1